MLQHYSKCLFALLAIVLVAASARSAILVSGQSSYGSQNNVFNPLYSMEPSVTVQSTIQGTSNLSGPLVGCPSGTYNFDYQSNLLQGAELGNSWIQQVVEVSTSGNSCYTVEYWPNFFNATGGPDYYSFGIGYSSLFYSQSSKGFNFYIDAVQTGNTYTVTDFYLQACCDSAGNQIVWSITPSELSNSPTIEFDNSSQYELNIVATGSTNTEQGIATFTAGQGTIDYCSYNSNGGPNVQTEETGNMAYSGPTYDNNPCAPGQPATYYWDGYYQYFAAPVIRQSNEGHNSESGGIWATNFNLPFSSSVTQGDLLVATVATYEGGTSFGISDSQGNTWTPDGGVGGPGYCSPNDCVQIWHTIAKTSGSDTVTFTTTQTSAYTYGFVMEFNGYSGTLDKSSYGSGTGRTPQVSSFSPSTYSVVVDVAAQYQATSWQSGQYYTMAGGNYAWYAVSEYSVSWNHGSTTAPWSTLASTAYAELAASYFIN